MRTEVTRSDKAIRTIRDEIGKTDVVRIVDEHIIGFGVTVEEKVQLVILDEELYQIANVPKYNAKVTAVLPLAVIFRFEFGKKVVSLIFLPKHFHILTALLENAAIGFLPNANELEKMISLSLPEDAAGVLNLVFVVSIFLLPNLDELHQAALALLEKFFPNAEWLIDYYTRPSQGGG